MKTYKGFDKNMKCRDFQYEIGKTYKHDGVAKACESGFHACEYPLDVFNYYNPADSVFCVVEQDGEIARHGGDSKIASTEITIGARISINDMAAASVDFIMSRVKKTKKKSATNTGDQSAATNTGNWSAATNTGSRSAATNTGNWSAATNTGSRSAATNTGYQSAAIIDGAAKESIAAGFGYANKAKASDGNWIVLAHRDDNGVILHIKSAKAGVDIKPDVFYTLDSSGIFIEEN